MYILYVCIIYIYIFILDKSLIVVRLLLLLNFLFVSSSYLLPSASDFTIAIEQRVMFFYGACLKKAVRRKKYFAYYRRVLKPLLKSRFTYTSQDELTRYLFVWNYNIRWQQCRADTYFPWMSEHGVHESLGCDATRPSNTLSRINKTTDLKSVQVPLGSVTRSY